MNKSDIKRWAMFNTGSYLMLFLLFVLYLNNLRKRFVKGF